MARHDPEPYRKDDPEWQRIVTLKGEERLSAYVGHLNNLDWVRDSGKLYFVAKRQKADGTTEHYVDRAI